jgi:predicted lysophospholipase L1 biosynthesis ABC-type transport system permease subunit
MGMNFRNFWRALRERDLDDEIRSHRTMAANDRMVRGEPPQSARDSVLLECAAGVAGLVIGMGAARELAQLLSKMLFGAAVHDPLTFGVAAALLFAVALAACFVPAWRAAGVGPMRCLRCD